MILGKMKYSSCHIFVDIKMPNFYENKYYIYTYTTSTDNYIYTILIYLYCTIFIYTILYYIYTYTNYIDKKYKNNYFLY